MEKKMTGVAMRTCGECGATGLRAEVLPEYVETLGGMQVVIRNAVIREYCPECGDETIEIPDSRGLVKAAAMARALINVQLSGDDVRFIRKALDMNGRQFSEAMEVSAETISRWESGVRGIGSDAEKLLRHNVCALLHTDVPTLTYNPIDIVKMKIYRSDCAAIMPVVFERVVVRDCSGEVRGWDRFEKAA